MVKIWTHIKFGLVVSSVYGFWLKSDPAQSLDPASCKANTAQWQEDFLQLEQF